jgi:hypothetical protein
MFLYLPFTLVKKSLSRPIDTKDRGREATVISIQPNAATQQDLAAGDKYIVQFEEGDEADFYEIQLTKVPVPGELLI